MNTCCADACENEGTHRFVIMVPAKGMPASAVLLEYRIESTFVCVHCGEHVVSDKPQSLQSWPRMLRMLKSATIEGGSYDPDFERAWVDLQRVDGMTYASTEALQ